MLGAKFNEYRGQLQEQQQRSFDAPSNSTFDSSNDLPGKSRLGDNYNTSI